VETKLRQLVLGAFLLAAGHAQAGLVRYEMTFTPTFGGAAAAGAGSFLWDDASLLMSEFRWVFEGSFAGGISDSTFASDPSAGRNLF
jgi:hypothetical protein